MKVTDKHRDLVPEEFGSEEEAAEFWDTHSLADYEEILESAEVGVDIRRRRFEIEVDENIFHGLAKQAKTAHTSIKDLASQILKEKLATA